MDRRGSLTSFEMLEADWADLRRAFETLVVDRHRGLPVDETAYRRRRHAFGAALAAVDVRSLPEIERDGIACMRGALPGLDEYEPIDEEGPDALEPPDVATLRCATYEVYGEAASAIHVGAETIDRLTAFARLATEPDASARRSIFEAMDPIWRSVDGDGGGQSPYRRLVAASADRWQRDGSPIEANAAILGIDPGAFESMLRDILAAGRRALGSVAPSGTGRIEPWDVRYITGEAERRLGGSVPRDRLRPINDAHLRSLGADPEALRISYDIFPRSDRPPIPVAFSIGGKPGPWVFATYEEGGLGNLAELLHESGHAIHEAAIRTHSAFAYPPVDHTAFIEAIAELTGWDVGEAGFQARHLGTAVEPPIAALDRYGPILLDACWALFEIEIHRSPGRRPNDVWSTIVADGLGIEPYPEWSWWAVRGQLIDSPGYLANYPLGAIAAAAMRARIRDIRGDWSAGDPGWYAFVSEHLLRFGGERSPAAVLEGFLDGPLDAQPLLDDLARAG